MTTQQTTVKKPSVPRVCSQVIKDDNLDKVKCGKRFVNGVCGNESIHVSKYKTGFCSKGWCEGANPKTFSGNPAPTCKMWKTCGCNCHDMFDLIYKESGLPREIVNNSQYVPDTGGYWMPSPEERMAILAASRPGVPDGPTVVESPLPEAVPATLRRSYTPTPTGRAARGELEAWVKEQCDIWIVEKEEFPCTPTYISGEIARDHGIREPSVGAISAVFDRWVKIGFAVTAKKPTRFVKYTEDGVRLGLDGCKDKAKRAKRSIAANSARTLRSRRD